MPIRLNGLRTALGGCERFKKIGNGNLKTFAYLQKESGIQHRPFVMGHALNRSLRFSWSLKLPEAHIVRFAFHRLNKNRVAILENADRYT